LRPAVSVLAALPASLSAGRGAAARAVAAACATTPRYGYRRMHALLRREGWACNRKRVQRLWRDEGLRLPPKVRRRRRGRRAPGHVSAACPDQVWALDFLVDRTADGRPIKILTVTDEHTREALATPAARRITADDTISTLEQIVERRGRAPAFIRCDNGPELTAEALKDWCRFNNTTVSYIEPGAPLAEPLRRVLQRPPPQRTARPRVVQHPTRNPAAPRRLAPRLQPPPATSITQLPNPSSLRPPMAC
jgi:transposase InsO family protein